jgi:hypothetical protein
LWINLYVDFRNACGRCALKNVICIRQVQRKFLIIDCHPTRPHALLVWWVSQGFGSVHFRTSASQHIAFMSLYFLRKKAKCSLAQCENAAKVRSIKVFLILCVNYKNGALFQVRWAKMCVNLTKGRIDNFQKISVLINV